MFLKVGMVELSDGIGTADALLGSDDIVALDEALAKLSEKDHGLAELVKLRCFAGLTLDQVAKIQSISRRTAGSYWSYARAWLRREITGGHEPKAQ